ATSADRIERIRCGMLCDGSTWFFNEECPVMRLSEALTCIAKYITEDGDLDMVESVSVKPDEKCKLTFTLTVQRPGEFRTRFFKHIDEENVSEYVEFKPLKWGNMVTVLDR